MTHLSLDGPSNAAGNVDGSRRAVNNAAGELQQVQCCCLARSVNARQRNDAIHVEMVRQFESRLIGGRHAVGGEQVDFE